ncbi:MAG: hypothetical protein JWO46_1362 [Nocardioidaceae bacterium]|nr:hypothetical protein [Nocardioidaceae bacterium]
MTTGSQTLERGLALLLELARHSRGLTTSEVAVAAGLHRSIAHRLLVSLQRTGFADRDDAGRWTVGPTASELGDRAWPRLRAVIEPLLHTAAADLDATVSLVEVRGDAVVTTVVAEPPTDGPRFSYRLGNRDPLDRGAGGLAALASGPFVAGEPDRVAGVRTEGHASTYAELHPGAFGVAVPVPGWGVRAAVTVVTADEDVARRALEPLLALVAGL